VSNEAKGANVIRVVTDSSCDLPHEVAVTHRIAIVPLTIRFGDREYVDRIDLTQDEFWDRLRTSTDLPETSAPSAGDFRERFMSLAEEGADGIVAVCLSSSLSATYQAAVIAAEQTTAVPVTVVDSRNVSMALGFQVLEAARAAARGDNLEQVAAAALAARDRSSFVAALDTLEYLQRGGRIGSTQAFLGGLLNIKPLITVENGVVAAVGRVRTRTKALAALGERAARLGSGVEEIAILTGDSPDVEDFRQQLSTVFPIHLIAGIGPIVGTHSGPGVLGIAYRLKAGSP
jgi:DegV family protein with EDD domain